MLRFRLSSPLLLALGCLPACYCSHEVIGHDPPDAGTVAELTDGGAPMVDSAHPGSDAGSEPEDGGIDAGPPPSIDMGAACAGDGVTDPDRACVPAPQGGTLSVERPSVVQVELPNPGRLCAPPGAAKCDVRVDWDRGVLELCTYRVLTPGGAHECPPTVEAECHFPPLEMARSWTVHINAREAFVIDSKVEADPDETDRCFGLGSMDEVRVRAD